MVPVPNSTAVVRASEAAEPERSPCMVGIFPIVYYSVLLGLGLPGEGSGAGGGCPGPWGGQHPTCII